MCLLFPHICTLYIPSYISLFLYSLYYFFINSNSYSRQGVATVRKLTKVLLNSYLVQLLETGFLHADPHPGSLSYHPCYYITYYPLGSTDCSAPLASPYILTLLLTLLSQATFWSPVKGNYVFWTTV